MPASPTLAQSAASRAERRPQPRPRHPRGQGPLRAQRHPPRPARRDLLAPPRRGPGRVGRPPRRLPRPPPPRRRRRAGLRRAPRRLRLARGPAPAPRGRDAVRRPRRHVRTRPAPRLVAHAAPLRRRDPPRPEGGAGPARDAARLPPAPDLPPGRGRRRPLPLAGDRRRAPGWPSRKLRPPTMSRPNPSPGRAEPEPLRRPGNAGRRPGPARADRGCHARTRAGRPQAQPRPAPAAGSAQPPRRVGPGRPPASGPGRRATALTPSPAARSSRGRARRPAGRPRRPRSAPGRGSSPRRR